MDPCHDRHLDTPDERPILDLGAEELFVVSALRAWVAPHMRPGQLHPDWRDIFRLAGVPVPGMLGFDVMMSVIGGSAQRLLEVRCCRCPGLGADEAALLRLVAALQAGDTLGALDVLTDWLLADAVSPALHGARRFAGQMAAAGLRLAPIRAATLH